MTRLTLKKYIARKTFKLRKGYSKSDVRHQVEVNESREKIRQNGIVRCAELFKPIFDNTKNIKDEDVILLTMGQNENKRIPYFIEYYQQLGVDHFIFIDNCSDEPMSVVIPQQSNISLWHTSDGYAKSNFGVDWMNYFNLKHGIGHWVLTVDLDEFFVFPDMENRSFKDFLYYLDKIEQVSVFAPLIDMYPKGSINTANIQPGESPLNKADHYDSSGYQVFLGKNNEIYLKGGPRLHHFCGLDLDKAPTLNKTPLIKWQANFLYMSSTHEAFPPFLNGLNPNQNESASGALLHFKFVSEIKEKAKRAIKSNNHYNNSEEYKTYLSQLEKNENLDLTNYFSKKYIDSSSLIQDGLIKTGYWL